MTPAGCVHSQTQTYRCGGGEVFHADETHWEAGTRLKVTCCKSTMKYSSHFRRRWVRDTDAQEETRGLDNDKEKQGQLSVFPAHPPAWAMACSWEGRLPKLSLRCHVWMQSLPPSWWQMALHSEYQPIPPWSSLCHRAMRLGFSHKDVHVKNLLSIFTGLFVCAMLVYGI